MNGVSLNSVTHEQAVGILKSSSDTVVLLVHRDTSSFVYQGSSAPQTPTEDAGKVMSHHKGVWYLSILIDYATMTFSSLLLSNH